VKGDGGGAARGVLVMAHGTPQDPGEIEAFYTRIRRGRPPSSDQLAELVARYTAIGGVSPLTERTAAQVAGLTERLAAAAPARYAVELGTKFALPSIEGGVQALAGTGVHAVIGLVLTPHRSTMGSDDYHRRATQALAELDRPIAYLGVSQFFDAAGFSELLATRVREAMSRLGPAARDDAVVVFTAHSLPARVLTEGDPYPDQLAASATSIAAAAGLATWRVAFQSAGRTPEPWLGPDLLDVLRQEAADGRTGVVVCPVGFVADHLEVLYDLDIEARKVAEGAGLAFTRTRSLNADPSFLDVLARVVRAADPPGGRPGT
jgi:protoporphyrin/coproporphyrin ferrochelatase